MVLLVKILNIRRIVMNQLKKVFNLSEYQEKTINLEKKEVDIKN